MRRIAVIALAAGLVLATASPASASDLSGRWRSAALKMDGVGYSMSVAAADSPANAYTVVLRFHYQDGKLGPRVKAGLTTNGRRLFLLLNGKGALADANNPNIMKGTLGQDGSMFFPTCYRQLTFVTKKTADADCLFQQLPS